MEIYSEFVGQVIKGTDDNDELTAVHNDVTLIGGSGDDNLFSQDGVVNTTMDGGAGNDLLNGSHGTNDTASYASAPEGVTVDLFVEEFDGVPLGIGVAFNDGNGGTDALIGIENVTGSAFDDTLTGDDFANVLNGGADDDRLTGNGGKDVFKYSFTPTSGQGTSSTFTDFLSEKFGKDFGEHLPDYVPAHHHKHDQDDKHGKDDKHHSKDDDHGKNDQHDKHGKDDGHHSKDGDHDHHGHGGDDGHHAPASGLTENFFEQNYKEWLKEVVVADLLEQGIVLDANGDGKIKIDLNEDSRNGTPRIEGLTKDQLAEIFGDRDSVILNDHGDTEKAWYSNSFASGNGKDTVASTDGFDTIVDFTFGEDKLDFSGITEDQFRASFVVDDTQNVDGLGGMDTVITIAGNADWSLTLLEVSGHDQPAFAVDIFA